jgi:hypothetical protein
LTFQEQDVDIVVNPGAPGPSGATVSLQHLAAWQRMLLQNANDKAQEKAAEEAEIRKLYKTEQYSRKYPLTDRDVRLQIFHALRPFSSPSASTLVLYRSEPGVVRQPVYMGGTTKPLIKYWSPQKTNNQATFWSLSRHACCTYMAGGYGGPIHYGHFRAGGLKLVIKRDCQKFLDLVVELMRLLNLLYSINPAVEMGNHTRIENRDDLDLCFKKKGRHSWPQDVFCFASEEFKRFGMWPWLYTVLESTGPDPNHTMVATEVIVHNRKNMIYYGPVRLNISMAREVQAKVHSHISNSDWSLDNEEVLGWSLEDEVEDGW